MIHIREATPADVALILDLIRGLAEYEKLASSVVATEERLRESLFGQRPYAHVLIAEYNGSPAGFALYFFNYSTFLAAPGLYLEDLFVKPEHRGQGIGKALFEALFEVARERQCGRMEWMVLDWNEPAHEFYTRMGAQQVQGWHVWRIAFSS